MSAASPVNINSLSPPSYPAVLGRGGSLPQKSKVPPPVPPRGSPRIKGDATTNRGNLHFAYGSVTCYFDNVQEHDKFENNIDSDFELSVFGFVASPSSTRNKYSESSIERSQTRKDLPMKISKLTSGRLMLHGTDKFSSLKLRHKVKDCERKIFMGALNGGTY